MRHMGRLAATVIGGVMLISVVEIGWAQDELSFEHRTYQERPDSTVDTSWSDLDGYGDWVRDPEYGRVWRPWVETGWRPYERGTWVWEGTWVWVSDDPWGDTPFHYGEWVPSVRYGWVWIPGSEWAPARVVWVVEESFVVWIPVRAYLLVNRQPSWWVGADLAWFSRPVVRPRLDRWRFEHRLAHLSRRSERRVAVGSLVGGPRAPLLPAWYGQRRVGTRQHEGPPPSAAATAHTRMRTTDTVRRDARSITPRGLDDGARRRADRNDDVRRPRIPKTKPTVVGRGQMGGADTMQRERPIVKPRGHEIEGRNVERRDSVKGTADRSRRSIASARAGTRDSRQVGKPQGAGDAVKRKSVRPPGRRAIRTTVVRPDVHGIATGNPVVSERRGR